MSAISLIPTSLAELKAWRALRKARDTYEAACLDRTIMLHTLDEHVENAAREYRAAQDHFASVSRSVDAGPASPDVPGVSAVLSSEQTTESRGQTLTPAPTSICKHLCLADFCPKCLGAASRSVE
jgi:hypothetical protein